MKKFLFFPMICFSLALLSACADDLSSSIDSKNAQNAENTFNFATTKSIDINIAYNTPTGYPVLVEIYGDNPYTATSGSLEIDGSQTPLFVGFAKDGKFNEKISIPTSVENLYVYSPYAGVPRLLEAAVGTASSISLDASCEVDPENITTASSLKVQSRSTSTPSYLSYLTWNKYGRVNQLISIDALQASTLTTINKTLHEGSNNKLYAMSTDFYISKDATVNLRYIDGTTAGKNTLGYYCFKGITPPTDPAKLNKVVVFPNANKYGNASIKNNDAVKLRFYNPDTKVWNDTFPQGYTIGFFIVNGGGQNYAKGNPTFANGATYYSTTAYNSDKRTHTAAFDIKDNGSTIRVLGFEDFNDNDYNDVMFSLHATPISALGPVPEVDPDQKETVVTTSSYGIMAYEDLWPFKGDFDLNDVVVKYSCKLFIGENDGKVIKTEDTWTLLWSGAAMHDAFAYEMNVPASNIQSSTITGDYTFSGQGLATNGAAKAVFKLFESANTIVSDQAGSTKTVTVTNVFKNRVAVSDLSAPYNPFIIPNADKGDRREVHFVDYAPSSLADVSLLGKNDDLSVPSKGLYYRATGNYPFAIHMPYVTDLGAFLSRKYEMISIENAFPKYTSWVQSNGTLDKDWYLYPVK